MKTIIILCSLTLVIFSNSLAQVDYRHIYSTRNNSAFYNEAVSKITSDSGMVLCQQALDSLSSTGYGYSVFKTDRTGNVLWSSYIYWTDSLSFTVPRVDDIIELADKSYLILAHIQHICLFHIDSVGNLMNAKELRQGGIPSIGYSMKLNADSTLTISGYSAFNTRGLQLKSSLAGSVIWAKGYHSPRSIGTVNIGNCELHNIISTHDGGSLLVGYLTDSATAASWFHSQIFKTDSLGNVEWAKTILDGMPMGAGIPKHCYQTSSGDFIVIGQEIEINNNPEYRYQTILKLGGNGIVKWYKGYKNAYFTGFSEINGNYFLGGSYRSDSFSTWRMGVSVMDTGGTPLPELFFQGNNYNSLLYMDSLNYNTYNLSTLFNQNNSAIFYFMDNSQSPGYYYPGLLKTDTSFHSTCYTTGYSLYDTLLSLNEDTAFTTYNFAYTSSDITSNFGSHGLNVTANNHCTPLAINLQLPNSYNFELYPNPSSGKFTAEFPSIFSSGTILIYNTLGETIWEEELSNILIRHFDLSHMGPGIYFVKVITGAGEYAKKLIVHSNY